MTLFVKVIFADIIRKVKIRSYWALNTMIGIFTQKERKIQTQRHQGRRPCNDGGRDWSDNKPSQGMSRIASSHQKLGGKEGFFPRGSRGNQHFDFRLLSSKTVTV